MIYESFASICRLFLTRPHSLCLGNAGLLSSRRRTMCATGKKCPFLRLHYFSTLRVLFYFNLNLPGFFLLPSWLFSTCVNESDEDQYKMHYKTDNDSHSNHNFTPWQAAGTTVRGRPRRTCTRHERNICDRDTMHGYAVEHLWAWTPANAASRF